MQHTTNYRLQSMIGFAVALLVMPYSVRADDEADDGAAEFEALVTIYKDAADVYNNLPQAESKEARQQQFEELYPGNSLGDQFFQLEEKYRGSQVGLSCLHHLVSTAGGVSNSDLPTATNRREAILLLQEHYLGHPDLDLVFWWFRVGARYPEAKALLQEAATHSPHRHIRGAALFALADLLVRETWMPGRIDTNLMLLQAQTDQDQVKENIEWFRLIQPYWKDVDASESRDLALQTIGRITEDYPDVLDLLRTPYGPVLLKVERNETDDYTTRKRKPLSVLAASLRFDLEHLSVGRSAPNISQPDAFGDELDLSQHRGKVVVLMFSFKGCGPCEAMYPDNRALIEEMQGRPFAFLGVMSDETIDTVKESVANEIITWPVWWEGPERAISIRWNVGGYPTVYVIDHEGIIRFKKLSPSLLRQAVLELVDAAANAE